MWGGAATPSAVGLLRPYYGTGAASVTRPTCPLSCPPPIPRRLLCHCPPCRSRLASLRPLPYLDPALTPSQQR